MNKTQSKNALTPERVAEPLPEWLADIEARCDDDTDTTFNEAMRRLSALLELCKAQRAAMEGARAAIVGTGDWPGEEYDRARRLWEGR